VLHLDESCLGNGAEGPTPGGAGGLIEVRLPSGVQRRDFYIHNADTTNNRMALSGAIAALNLMAGKGRRLRALIVSDSEYLVRGMREWVPGWIGRGWTRKGGAIENLNLWQALVHSARLHQVQWAWVRGHRGHVKNEYADDLAVRAATDRVTSLGAVESGFPAWLAQKQGRGLYGGYDADATFLALERRIKDGEAFPLELRE
jgi:ribonuclease HI